MINVLRCVHEPIQQIRNDGPFTTEMFSAHATNTYSICVWILHTSLIAAVRANEHIIFAYFMRLVIICKCIILRCLMLLPLLLLLLLLLCMCVCVCVCLWIKWNVEKFICDKQSTNGKPVYFRLMSSECWTASSPDIQPVAHTAALLSCPFRSHKTNQQINYKIKTEPKKNGTKHEMMTSRQSSPGRSIKISALCVSE